MYNEENKYIYPSGFGGNNYLSDPILQFIYETMQICINIEIYTIENRTFTKSFT